ncbi:MULTISPECIES: imidazole glycerol phosphate synthase subunit HisH [Methylomonas]|uniref:Imidazole glycerol phosphate synthase subunit HisH n=1 Tax=Methylomonas koyamae TaxID=702114 RepID=A0A291IEJ7_9GAMM|nr:MULTISPECIES: imidazole glycerol phosphate synthase subunit HisH [Methylomonas]ANE53965.1 imidazole glycerol phosphate synthase subunit HisH [Methylomonas sp. DH-1]ATG88601.1 imidazole glycerol phosphate synthase [Methylomonas koyamae]OAI27477.1 imidazole glycerol phosphate synthase subunit HisH [Methylomonas koyamae]WNB76260.1 imidazole glycerol phosphate synthase subunit HisH [Methylomonas koyamae]
MPSVAVIDYGMGNLHSIAKALQHADSGSQVLVSSDPEAIRRADRVVFPGVGAIRDCMSALHGSGLAEVIREVAADKPLLGVCLGMQALLTDSEENGGVACLGLLPGHVRRFADDLRDDNGNVLKIPHMGWNRVEQKPHPLWKNIPDRSRFYFVHSYYAVPDDARHTAATADYPQTFTCALADGNLFAVQFHPEKSQTVGLQLLQNFLAWDGTV